MLKVVVDFVSAAVERWRQPAAGTSGRAGDSANYTLLIEQQEPIDSWSVCTICLNVDRTASVARKRWRCADCGIDAGNNTQQQLTAYLTENSVEAIENNLKQWGNVKGVRAAYKMLRSARYKCLLTLSKRLHG